MSKTLVLAEKPSVARDIARVLGSKQNCGGFIDGPKYIVTWALGHLVTLAEPEAYGNKYREWSLETLPMLPDKMELVVIKNTAKQFNTVRSLMQRADVSELVIATDSGREGELVARWIMQKAGFKKPAKRLWISSQTDKAVQEGFRSLKPAASYDNLYKSASCRAQADWLVGLNVTRALTCKYNAQLSAGRVQTPTLSMIAMREDEIRNFKPKEYYTINVNAAKISFLWQDKKTSNARIFDKEKAELITKKLSAPNQHVVVQDVKKQDKRELPPLAYDLTELQRDANKLYSLSAKKTLSVMQSLYETHKLVTYPRTDSKYIPRDIVPTLPERLKSIAVGPYAAAAASILRGGVKTTDRFVDDKKVTDHHAIIPTEQYVNLNALDTDERKVYGLIVKRFLCVLSSPFEYEETVLTVVAADEKFVARGRVIKSEGWHGVLKDSAVGSGGNPFDSDDDDDDDDDYADDAGDDAGGSGVSGKNSELRSKANLGIVQELPKVSVGDKYPITGVKMNTGKTKPPSRYTEATLLGAMERPGKFIDSKELKKVIENASGIGTPATRADIIEKLFDSFYVERGGKSGKQIIPTSKGLQLVKLAPTDLRSPELTAKWEQTLEQISRGTSTDSEFIANMRKYASKLVSSVIASSENFKHDNITHEKCPDCGKYLLSVNSKKGEMLLCQDRECGYRKSVVVVSNARCPECHKKLEIRGEGKDRVFFCVCGHRERVSDFEKRKDSEVGKREVQNYLNAQNRSSASGDNINSALAEQLARLMEKNNK